MPRPPKIYKSLDEETEDDNLLIAKEDSECIDADDIDPELKEVDEPKDEDGGAGGRNEPIFKIAGADDADDDFIPGAIRRNKPPEPMWSDDLNKLKFRVGDLVCFKNDLKRTQIYKIGQYSTIENYYDIIPSGSNISRVVCDDKLVKAPTNKTWNNFWEINDPYLMWKKSQESKKIEEIKLKEPKKTSIKKKKKKKEKVKVNPIKVKPKKKR